MEELLFNFESIVIEEPPRVFKTCKGCQEEKESSEFYRNKYTSDGLAYECKKCVKRYSWKTKLARYGLTTEDYNNMLLAQENSCAICGSSDRSLVIDHDHKTNKVRGLLCSNCNTGIGKLGDTSELLRRAIDYLDRT